MIYSLEISATLDNFNCPASWRNIVLFWEWGDCIIILTSCRERRDSDSEGICKLHQNCASIKGKPTVLRLEEESDRDVACHPYYLTYVENI